MTPPRPYVSVDVENLVYGLDVHSDAERVEFLLRDVLPAAGDRWAGDATLVRGRLAATLTLAVMDLPDGCDLRVRPVQPAPDAADVDLVDRLVRAVPARTERAVIFSGDQRFADPARRLRDRGVHITVVGLRGCIHHLLWPASDRVVEVDPLRSAFAATA